jgi:hypothetical protein
LKLVKIDFFIILNLNYISMYKFASFDFKKLIRQYFNTLSFNQR